MSAERAVLPNVSSKTRLMGCLSIIFGALAIAMPWIAGQSILMLIGVLTLLAGIAVIANPLMSSAVLTIMLAAV